MDDEKREIVEFVAPEDGKYSVTVNLKKDDKLIFEAQELDDINWVEDEKNE